MQSKDVVIIVCGENVDQATLDAVL
jgi:hypothetical protein